MARIQATCVQVADCHVPRRAGFTHRRSRPAGLADLPAFGGNSSSEQKHPPEKTWNVATPMEHEPPKMDYDSGDEDDFNMTEEQEALMNVKNNLFNLNCQRSLARHAFYRKKLHEEEAVAHAASLCRHEHSELQFQEELSGKAQSELQTYVLRRQLEEVALCQLRLKCRSVQDVVNVCEQNNLAEERRHSILRQQAAELHAAHHDGDGQPRPCRRGAARQRAV